MILTRLQITIEPSSFVDGTATLRTTVDIQGKDTISFETLFTRDDFVSLFDYAWGKTKLHIDKAIGELEDTDYHGEGVA